LNSDISLGLAAAAGVLSFISPCVLPLVPAYLGYLSGTTVTSTGVIVTERRATFFHALSFVLGFAAIYTLLGASVGLFGYLLVDQVPLIQKAGGVVLVLFGLHTMGVLQIPFLYREFKMNIAPRREFGYISSALVGMIFAAGWTPCVGVILSGILLMAYSSSTVGQGALLLFTYSLGLGIPFLIVGAALDRLTPLLRRLNRRQRLISIVSGLLLILMGILVFTNFFQYLAAISAPTWRQLEGWLRFR
jgi:cytochrome c-type biogenesis protein